MPPRHDSTGETHQEDTNPPRPGVMCSLDQVSHTLLLLLDDVAVPHAVPGNVPLPVDGVEVIVLPQPGEVVLGGLGRVPGPGLAEAEVGVVGWVRPRPAPVRDVQQVIVTGAGLGHEPGACAGVVHDCLVCEVTGETL